MSNTHTHKCCKCELCNEDAQNLLPVIDTSNIRCLNELQPNSGHYPFKPWTERKTKSLVLESDENPELLLSIPFSSMVNLKSFCIIGSNIEGQSPTRAMFWSSRNDIDFTNAKEIRPTQEFNLADDNEGLLWYKFKPSVFNNTNPLTILLSNDRGEHLQVNYIGLKGDFTNLKQEAVTGVLYEARPVPQDHKTADSLSSQYLT